MLFNGETMTANFAGFAVPPVRVIITQNEDGTYKSGHTLTQILDAYDNGNAVYCQYGNMVLPLEMISKAFCSFACVHSGNVHTVQIGLASVTVTTTPVVKTVNGTAPDENGNVELDIQSGGGPSSSGGAFQFTITLEEDVSAIALQLPVTFGKLLQYNIHYSGASGLSKASATSLLSGGEYKNTNDFKQGMIGFNIYGVRYHVWSPDSYITFTMGMHSVENSADYAAPITSNVNRFIARPSKNDFTLYLREADVVFPAGATIDVWGVYA